MFIRSRLIVRHFGLSATTERPLLLETTDAPPVRIALRKIHDDEIKQFYESDDWVAEMCAEEDVSSKVCAQFESSGSEPTQAVKEILTRVSVRMTDFLTIFLRIVRWRTGVYGHHQVIRCADSGIEWSLDGTTWRAAAGLITVVASHELRSTMYTESLFQEIKGLLAEDQEPIGHELLREAWNLKATSPRSSLMLAVSALEVGVKEFIAKFGAGGRMALL
jgi:hypothetical protein